MMKKILIALFGAVSVSLAATPPCLNPISTVNWSFFADALEFKGFCSCTSPGKLKAGFKLQLAEPIAFIETPNKAWNFLCFGSTRSKFSVQKGDGTNVGKMGAKTNVHYIKYPVFAVLGLVFDNLCMTHDKQFDLIPTGLSEINPLLWDDELSILAQPWKLLIANPIAQSLCLGDCVASSVVSSDHVSRLESIRNKLFWCAGCWGAIQPDTTTTLGQDSVVESALTATKVLDLLSQDLQLKDYKEVSGLSWASKFSQDFPVPSDVACQPKYFPIIVKSQYWLNLSYPVHWDAIPIGDFPPLWAWFKKYPGGEQNIWTVWRIRTCCLGLQFP